MLDRKDKILIVLLSMFFAAGIFLTDIAYFYASEITLAGKISTTIFSIPAYFLSTPMGFLASLARDPEGASLGIAMLFTLLSPLVGFIFWFVIFYLCAKITKKFLHTQKTLTTNAVALILFLISAVSLTLYWPTIDQYHKQTGSFYTDHTMKIISVSPKAAHVGTKIIVEVSGLSHDGYMYANIVKHDHPQKVTTAETDIGVVVPGLPRSAYTYTTPTKRHTSNEEDEVFRMWVGKLPQDNLITFVLPSIAAGVYELEISAPGNPQADADALRTDFTVLP